MKDIAKALGYHQSTVSLALRGHHSIPAKTREKITAKAEEMGYRPNPLVSALIAERKKRRPTSYGSTLAFLTAFPEKNAWRHSQNLRRVFEALERRAPLMGYRVEEFWLHESGMTPARVRNIFLHRGIRGIVLCPLPHAQDTLHFDFSEFAGVGIGITLETPMLDRVAIDHYSMMNLAVQKLQEHGHRRIGFLSTWTVSARVNNLSLGAFLALRHTQAKHLVKPTCIIEGDREEVKKWLDAERPDAIITAANFEHQFLETLLREEGWDLPGDTSLICLDCAYESHQAGILQDLEMEAAAALDLVTRRVERAQFGVPIHPQTILINGTWREGPLLVAR